MLAESARCSGDEPAEPAAPATLSKTETVGEGDSLRRAFAASGYGGLGGLSWDETHTKTREMFTRFYRFVRAESDNRHSAEVRALETEIAESEGRIRELDVKAKEHSDELSRCYAAILKHGQPSVNEILPEVSQRAGTMEKKKPRGHSSPQG